MKEPTDEILQNLPESVRRKLLHERIGHQFALGKADLNAQRAEERAKKAEKRAEEAGRDHLTGLPRRHREEEFFADKYSAALREDGLLLVAMADIDRFKTVNDTYGHAAGDAALKHLTVVFNKTLRGDDHLFRHGGEEFLLLAKIAVSPSNGNPANGGAQRAAPESKTGKLLKDAKLLLERLRLNLEETPFVYEGKKIPLTVSIGAHIVKPPIDAAHNLTSMLKRVDAALYRAKERGRNRVVANVHEMVEKAIADERLNAPSRRGPQPPGSAPPQPTA